MKIPWAKPYIGKEELESVINCFKIDWLTMGPKVKELENYLSNFLKSSHAIAVNSGTAALDVALKLINIKPGDEIIIPALSYIATGNSVLYQFATPVFADIDIDTYTISPESVERLITDKTKAIIAIDYAGHPADYDALRKIIKDRDIYLIEDGAPGLGGEYKGKSLCSLGDISITSFHMAKTFTAVEGGMIFTDNDIWNKTARLIRSQGEDPNEKYHHPVLGHNYRMSDLHAAIGFEQIKRFYAIINKREMITSYYSKALKNIANIKLPKVSNDCKHAWFLYPILVNNRSSVVNKLKESNIEVNISWPKTIYEQEMFKKFNNDICPVAKDFTERVICLPLYFEMTNEEQKYVIENLIRIVGGSVE